MTAVRLSALLALAVLLGACFVGSAAAGTKAVPLTQAPADALSRALVAGELTEAEYALERARALFARGTVERRYGSVDRLDPRAATFVLRDLAFRVGELEGDDREAAERLLARPSDGPADIYGDGWTTTEAPASPVCEPRATPRWCVHWVETTEDAPPQAGAEGDGIPDWIDRTATAMEKVYAEQVDEIGFPRPKDDSSSIKPTGNPNGALDVYLANIGEEGYYGYCTTDDPDALQPGQWDVSAYCVVDDNFSPSEFPATSGQRANKVTLAHEVHHAEQFALDAGEDIWAMEGGATYMEWVVYPRIHDNYQYLETSHITRPGLPLDSSDPSSLSVYGNWIFFYYLSERLGGPRVIRRIWRHLDAREGRPDAYSTQGIKRVLAAEDTSLRRVLAKFEVANRRPRDSYDLPGLPRLVSPTARRHAVGPANRVAGNTMSLDHLAGRWVAIRRGGQAGRNADLLLELDLPNRARGSEARIMVVRESGARETRRAWLGPRGNGRLTVPFGERVRRVELLLLNASARFDCWNSTWYSCQGDPRHDNGAFSYQASLR